MTGSSVVGSGGMPAPGGTVAGPLVDEAGGRLVGEGEGAVVRVGLRVAVERHVQQAADELLLGPAAGVAVGDGGVVPGVGGQAVEVRLVDQGVAEVVRLGVE